MKFVFYPSKLKKQPLFANNFKIQGGPRPPCPPSDVHACRIICIGAPENGGMAGPLPPLGALPPFKRDARGVEVPFHNSIIGKFMVYQDRPEINLLQLFGHPDNSECFSIISVIIFEVNIVDKQKQT